MIYFGQQVEAYIGELKQILDKNNFSAKPVPLPESQKMATAPQSEPSSATVASKTNGQSKRTLATVAKQQLLAAAKPDVSEERLEHMQKMKQKKSLLSETEMSYYSQLNTKDENDNLHKPENNHDDQLAEVATDDIATVNSKKKVKRVMSVEVETYYSNIAKKSAAKEEKEDALMLGETAATMSSKHIEDWDMPLRHAKDRILSTPSLNVHDPLPNDQHSIDDDFTTDREEFFQESTKDDLVRTLQEQYRQSAKGKWTLLQHIFHAGHFKSWVQVPDNEDDLDVEVTNEDTVQKESYGNASQYDSPSLRPRKTIINVNNDNKSDFPPSQKTFSVRPALRVNFSTSEPTIIGADDASEPSTPPFTNGYARDVVNYRGILKRTDIDLESLRHTESTGEKPVYDFRKLLRKTGRLELIAASNN
ncbi:uncharacterized protein LOC127849335 [Dreissena polymorpha]|uniref:uncharacterized protein LOC127849335 n=1 Tax=Dreissena polymorpha TaxID=45954 RepID=UPI002264DEA4|nr:uncharacterized protein LOC127849335 [Dreissena polymorpha]